MTTTLDHTGDEGDGVRYYLPAWFILAYGDGAGRVTAEAKLLPDTTKIYSSKPFAYFAANNVELDFTDGVLTTGTANSDATTVPKSILDAAKDVAAKLYGKAARAMQKGPQWKSVPGPRLYKLVCTRNATGEVSDFSLVGAETEAITLPEEINR